VRRNTADAGQRSKPLLKALYSRVVVQLRQRPAADAGQSHCNPVRQHTHRTSVEAPAHRQLGRREIPTTPSGAALLDAAIAEQLKKEI